MILSILLKIKISNFRGNGFENVAKDCTLPLAVSTQQCTYKGGVSIKRDNCEGRCPLCKDHNKIISHLLKECVYAREF